MKRRNEDLVKSIINDFYARKEARKGLESKWLLNINFYTGNQYAEILPNGEISEHPKDYYWQQKAVYNHISPIMETRLAKFGNLRANVTVRPATNDNEDVNSAVFSTALLRSVEEENNFKALNDEATFWSEITGTSFYKIVWASNKGRRISVEEEIYEGDADISVCPPYEIYPDSLSAATLDECKSIIHARAYPVEEIEEIWGEKVKGENVSVLNVDAVRQGKNTDRIGAFCDEKKNHAVVIEKYVLPDKTHPDGRLTIVSGDKLLYDGVLPYINGVDGRRGFPFVRQVCLAQPASFFGSSVIERLIPVQRAYNAIKNRKHEYFNRMALGILMVEDGSVDIDNIEEEGLAPGKVVVYRQGSTPPVMVNMGGVPADFRDEEDRLLYEFVTVSGVSDFLTSSTVSSESVSGVALSLIIEQDNNRLSLTSDSIRNAVKEVGKQILRLYKQFANETRLKRISGKTGEMETRCFKSGDISCNDLCFDVENELVNTLANRKAIAAELYKMGVFNDDSGKLTDIAKSKILEIFGFGNWESVNDGEKLHKKKAEEENYKLAEKVPNISDMDNHSIHIDEHIKFLISNGDDISKENKDTLEKHIRTHRTYKRLTEEANTLSI